jgi:topoisomerase IA-like protein
MISEALGLFKLPNSSGTLESSSLIISKALGLFGCRIHVSLVKAVR